MLRMCTITKASINSYGRLYSGTLTAVTGQRNYLLVATCLLLPPPNACL